LARKSRRHDGIVVIGLGRFGSSLALELVDEETEVLGIDSRPDVVQQHAVLLTHAVVADTTNEEALRQLSVHEFDRAVVAIGTDVESSILTTSLLVRFGIRHIWAKAISDAHGRVLDQVGAHHVIYPERDMGQRVAHLVRGRMLDYIEFEDDFAMVKTNPPAELLGKPLGETGLRARYEVTVVAVKRRGEGFTYATTETVLRPGDVVIVAGRTRKAEHFSEVE
jgi:trk system potassium uptake protein TrkA